MEHTDLSMDYDKNLIETVLDDTDMRYIILFLYVIRNDLFKDLSNQELIKSYERVLILDEIYKDNIISFWSKEFIEIAIDLGLIKNIRSIREFEQKDGDFIIRLGEETVTIENNTISVPDHTLFLLIIKKFKFLTKRNFNLALNKLKGVRCEKGNIIHPFVFEIGDHDFKISDDLYYILDQYGNIFQAIKIEITVEGFYQRFLEIKDKIDEFIGIFEPKLKNKIVLKKINKAIEENKAIFQFLKDEKVELPEKFNYDGIDKENPIFKNWNSNLLSLLKYRYQLKQIETELLEIKLYYSGKGKKYNYLEFIEKVSFNEDNIVNNIQNALIDLREDVVKINSKITRFSKKELKLLNLDYERYIITSNDD